MLHVPTKSGEDLPSTSCEKYACRGGSVKARSSNPTDKRFATCVSGCVCVCVRVCDESLDTTILNGCPMWQYAKEPTQLNDQECQV